MKDRMITPTISVSKLIQLAYNNLPTTATYNEWGIGQLMSAILSKYSDDTISIFDIVPELLDYKPDNLEILDYWWDRTNVLPRLKIVLDLAVKLNYELYHGIRLDKMLDIIDSSSVKAFRPVELTILNEHIMEHSTDFNSIGKMTHIMQLVRGINLKLNN